MRSAVPAFLLSALILATSVLMGAARGQARVAGEILLCRGGAVVSVSVDARGAPVTPPHPCPDCVLHAFGVGAPPQGTNATLATSFVRVPRSIPPVSRLTPVAAVRPPVRGPPGGGRVHFA